ncbi:hypothetical protein PGT21_006210 [Puccinia graminis f. sp. tritici]|uniref:Uncharacterized protein n=1 Tax=Puccinia graminis f. sp. tritici TaxID=56615 RepID=A0A5B0S5U0_PUCGR|nr:hypothetical protein PGT21_006210 [Puccinia graminis f. sp. tritici]KAA1133260.1 hypothetical protein PGTUg99_015517 [Puccinia graminis f. sp. tritici]KAA1133264.1 hypothetical protein PGTUg99_016228 [Puccinia graminis f. sp. tritici]
MTIQHWTEAAYLVVSRETRVVDRIRSSTDSFELLRWGEDCRWEIPKFGDERGHERRGDIVPGSRFQPAVKSLEPTFDLNGTSDIRQPTTQHDKGEWA